MLSFRNQLSQAIQNPDRGKPLISPLQLEIDLLASAFELVKANPEKALIIANQIEFKLTYLPQIYEIAVKDPFPDYNQFCQTTRYVNGINDMQTLEAMRNYFQVTVLNTKNFEKYCRIYENSHPERYLKTPPYKTIMSLIDRLEILATELAIKNQPENENLIKETFGIYQEVKYQKYPALKQQNDQQIFH